MARIEEERETKEKRKGLVCPRVDELLKRRSKRSEEYIARSNGSPRYEVSSPNHNFIVNIEKKSCACGLWQLGGVPCVHAVCVYRALNKDPRKFVHEALLKTTFLEVYNHTLEPLNGPTMWTKAHILIFFHRISGCFRGDQKDVEE
ncbi:hypothetical protein LIER_09026 [Lithospermum erythrorhizon]|uniref:SWIM-type domain-containing protein n=1 Tax=Lithospermum erythrorhizon TaxID=34254 RepID=A0AAV3PI42_LITER